MHVQTRTTATRVNKWWSGRRTHIRGSALNKSTHCWIVIIIRLAGLKEDFPRAKVWACRLTYEGYSVTSKNGCVEFGSLGPHIGKSSCRLENCHATTSLIVHSVHWHCELFSFNTCNLITNNYVMSAMNSYESVKNVHVYRLDCESFSFHALILITHWMPHATYAGKSSFITCIPGSLRIVCVICLANPEYVVSHVTPHMWVLIIRMSYGFSFTALMRFITVNTSLCNMSAAVLLVTNHSSDRFKLWSISKIQEFTYVSRIVMDLKKYWIKL